jgi:hypothetical protein
MGGSKVFAGKVRATGGTRPNDAGGDPGTAACRSLPRHWLGLPASFAIVIVGGLIADLVVSIFLLPTLYVWIAGERDVLPEAEAFFEEGEHID